MKEEKQEIKFQMDFIEIMLFAIFMVAVGISIYQPLFDIKMLNILVLILIMGVVIKFKRVGE